ncbi:unnamed protein product, partial [Tilletia controversa]
PPTSRPKKVTEEAPFTPAEADRAAGLGVDNRQGNADSTTAMST